MADEKRIEDLLRRLEYVERRQVEQEKREAGMDVKVELNTSAMNRLSILIGTAGLGVIGTIVTFIFTRHG